MIPKYYKVEFSIQGKRFPCVVRFYEGDSHWLCIYINKDNGNDLFLRREVTSPSLLEHGEETYPEVFNNLWDKIKLIVDGKQ